MQSFKRVPSITKCINILQLFADTSGGLGISEISKALNYNKSTIFNILHTLVELGVLEQSDENKFQFGTTLYALGKANAKRSEMIKIIHPYLEEINRTTELSSFLGIRSGLSAVIIDKEDSAFDIKISSDIGMRIPLMAGAGGRALLSLMPDEEIDEILHGAELKQYTPSSCIDTARFRELIGKTRNEGIAYDNEEYIGGVCAYAIPLNIKKKLQVAIWAVGLRGQFTSELLAGCSRLLLNIKKEIESRFTN